MAHTCPECGLLCHCRGDIDDIDWGEDYGYKHCDPIEIRCAKCGNFFEIELHKKEFEGLVWCDECIELFGAE